MTRKRRSRGRKWLLALVIFILAAGIAAAFYLRPYGPDRTAVESMRSGGGVTVTDSRDVTVYEGAEPKEPGVIFYPGGLVKPESYAPLARELARRGHRTVVVKMPLNLAVLGGGRASAVLEAHPGESFVIGGHSLGGVMAARYAAEHPEGLRGVFFLASYADDKGSLRDKGLPVLSVTGSEDGVLNRDSFEKNKKNLPEDAKLLTLPGGNHGQFGSYGPQKGDRAASISPEEQTRRTAEAITDWMNGIREKGKN
ncbi:alpha/beta fold hydrolase [Paenibacillus chitinolyticus]|uniref:alpha/beta fold hydrolase n=1 Tax=Paenibacillus chitinolyticus TaxID=79263 RepID=UPI00355721E5